MRVTVVRPYGERIRQRMLAALSAAGLEVRPEHVVPAHSPDRVVLEAIRGRSDHVLMVPFNGQRDTEGNWTDGLQLLTLLEETTPSLPWAILMPVSRFGAAAAHLVLHGSGASGPSPQARERVLLIDEEELDDPSLPERIQTHLERCRSHRGEA